MTIKTKLFLGCLLFFFGKSIAQEPVAEISKNYTTQVIFPTEIQMCRLAINEKFHEPQQVSNILLLQATEPFSETNLTVLLADGLSYSIKLRYSDEPQNSYYIFKNADAVNFLARSVVDNSTKESTIDKQGDAVDNIESKILSQSGYITVRNAVKYKAFLFSITGIYVQKDNIYIRLSAENLSEIPYKIALVNFTIGVKKTKDVTSAGVEILSPTYISSVKEVKSKSKEEMVFGFSKFTIGKETELIIDIIEQEGARNLSLPISDDIFLQARQY